MGDKMIRKFEVENFKNFRDKITLDLTRIKSYGFNQGLIKNNLINKAVIYGRNGTGKTNLGLALFDLTFHLDDSLKSIPIKLYEDYLNAFGKKDYAEFSYEFLFYNHVILYHYKKRNIYELLYEELTINDEKVLIYNFENGYKDIKIKGTESLNFEFMDNTISVVKYIANNSNLEKEHPIKALLDYARSMFWFKSYQDGSKLTDEVFSNFIYKNKLIQDFQTFLTDFELDVKIDFMDSENKQILAFDYGNKKISFFKNASSGTRDLAWFYYWFYRFSKTSFLFVDEFDAYFHYELAIKVLHLINQFDNMQSIVTSHNTSLISNKELRPDCYFILGNNKVINLPYATEKELREAHNLEKMYRSGEFEI